MVAPANRRRRKRVSIQRKRVLDSSMIIDYKKPEILKKFITERGKIIPSRVSGATHSQQLAITKAVKRARYMALIPISNAHEKEKGFVGEMSEIAQTFSAGMMRQRSFAKDRGYGRRDEETEENDINSQAELEEGSAVPEETALDNETSSLKQSQKQKTVDSSENPPENLESFKSSGDKD